MFLNDFFQIGPIPADQLTGTYNVGLVILSYVVATLASYIALDITARLRDISNTPLSTALWLGGGAFVMGAGIWSMHFIGMLAFSMNMPMTYEAFWTALSMGVAIGASAFALFILRSKFVSLKHILLGGIFLGFAIAAMHYTGMEGMTTNMEIHYLPGLFFLSIIIAILASQVALFLALKSTEVISKIRFRLKFVSAFIMGAGICGMHYTGMAAAIFTSKPDMGMIHGAMNHDLLAISIAGATIFIISVAFIASSYKESLNQQLLLTARQAGMAEVAASVLHNVGNVLNSVNVTSMLISEKIADSKLGSLKDLNELIKKNKMNLGDFIQLDPKGQHIPEYLDYLANYWEAEQKVLMSEIDILKKNVEHIRNIIATQQDFSRVTEMVAIESIEKIISEATLISGLENNKLDIKVKHNYQTLKSVLIDKVKLLQILINLLKNAKDALLDSGQDPKILTISTLHSDKTFKIIISDTGIGISRDNQVKIFRYGFTTKESGHGFGLHSSAISAKEMGGSLSVLSKGVGEGATFTLELPYKSV